MAAEFTPEVRKGLEAKVKELGASPAQLAKWKRLFDGVEDHAFEFESASDVEALQKRVSRWSPAPALTEQQLLKVLKKDELGVAKLVESGKWTAKGAKNYRAEKLRWADDVRAGLSTIPSPLTKAEKDEALRRIRGEPPLNGKAPSPRALQIAGGVLNRLHPAIFSDDVIDLPPYEDVPPKQDLLPKEDLPLEDLPPKPDLSPKEDLPPKDLPPKQDLPLKEDLPPEDLPPKGAK